MAKAKVKVKAKVVPKTKAIRILKPDGSLYQIYTAKDQGKDFVGLAKQLVKKRKDVHGEDWKIETGKAKKEEE